MGIQTLIHSSETILQKDITKRQAYEMKFLRVVKGCSLRDHLRNEDT